MPFNVLLVNPPSPYLENDAAYPPMGLLYVAAAFEKEGCKVKVMDMAGGNSQQLSVPPETNLVGFTCVTPNANIVRKLAREVPHYIPVMVGGAHPTFITENDLAQVQVRGEFELVAPYIIADAISKRLQHEYTGMLTPPDKMISPARHLVDLHRYRPGGEETTPIYTSRGCSYQCAFCSKISKNTYREVWDIRTFAEIDECILDYGFKHLLLGDDNFFLHKQHACSILEYIRKNHDVKLRINTDTRSIRKDILNVAQPAGCVSISMGVESGSQKMLDAMNKQVKVERNLESIRLIKEMGIAVKIYLISNFPGETEETVDETLEFVRKAEPDGVLVSNFAPLPGSPVYENPDKYGITWMSDNWEDYYLVGKLGMYHPCFESCGLSKKRQLFNYVNLKLGLLDMGYPVS